MTFFEKIKNELVGNIDPCLDIDVMVDEIIKETISFIIQEVDYNGIDNSDLVMARILKTIASK